MTMKEFKRYLERDIAHYENMVRQTENTSVHASYVKTLEELKDIRKVINT